MKEVAVGEDLERKRRIYDIVRVESKKFTSRNEKMRVYSTTPTHRKEQGKKVSFKINLRQSGDLDTEYVQGIINKGDPETQNTKPATKFMTRFSQVVSRKTIKNCYENLPEDLLEELRAEQQELVQAIEVA